jgi:hypothetical protein
MLEYRNTFEAKLLVDFGDSSQLLTPPPDSRLSARRRSVARTTLIFARCAAATAAAATSNQTMMDPAEARIETEHGAESLWFIVPLT